MSAPVIRASTVGPVPTMLTDTAVAANGDFLEQIVKKVIDLIFFKLFAFRELLLFSCLMLILLPIIVVTSTKFSRFKKIC